MKQRCVWRIGFCAALFLVLAQKVGADEATALQGGRAKNALLAVADGDTANAANAAAGLPATGRVEALFTPWDDVEGTIVRALDAARKSIHVQAYLLTSRPIARALLAAQARGVKVEILADREMVMSGQNSRIPELAEAGIPIWLETRYAIAHNKIMLLDSASEQGAVITGSYNFTWSAQARNAENLLILRDNPALQQRFLNNWQRHRAEAEIYQPGKKVSHEH